jgi:glycosyltransferase involved in cell wall biosynthesis
MPEKVLRVSVVIPTYKRPDQVRNAVRSVFNQDLDKSAYDLFVVDGSPDDSVADVMRELLPQAPCRVRYIRKKPEGPGASRNVGLQESSAPILAFMDSDCAATPGWLRAALDAVDDRVGIVQGAVQPDPQKKFGVFSHSLLIDRETYFYETANVFYRRECFQEVGGFMQDWLPRARRIVGGEDVDMAWRVKRKGWKTRFRQDALVYHDVTTAPVWDWIWLRPLLIMPFLKGRYPEIEPCFYRKYFYNKAQAFLLMGLSGLALTWLTPFFLCLWVPYLLHRASQPTRTLIGPLRALRPLFYCVHDFASFILLSVGSIRARTVLL